MFQLRLNEREGSAKISWRGTWALPLSPRVVKVWQAVVSERVGCEIQIVMEILNANLLEIEGYGDAIRYLRLEGKVMHPVSMWQMRKEGACQIKSRH